MPPSIWTTALVTGASSGIGDRIARRLAAGGTQLVVVARDKGRLDALAKELAEQHAVDVEVLAADLADPTGVALVEDRLRDGKRAIDLLVNNAGFGANGDFVEVETDRLVGMIDVNVTAVVRLTRAALPGMIERGDGYVLNISSMASLQPSPGFSVYGATKAFVTAFTESLHEELRGTGVHATAVCPGFTSTEFQERAGYSERGGLPGFLWQSADAVASEALVAAAKGRAVVVTGTVNKVTAGVSGPVPRSLKRRVVGELSKRF